MASGHAGDRPLRRGRPGWLRFEHQVPYQWRRRRTANRQKPVSKVRMQLEELDISALERGEYDDVECAFGQVARENEARPPGQVGQPAVANDYRRFLLHGR